MSARSHPHTHLRNLDSTISSRLVSSTSHAHQTQPPVNECSHVGPSSSISRSHRRFASSGGVGAKPSNHPAHTPPNPLVSRGSARQPRLVTTTTPVTYKHWSEKYDEHTRYSRKYHSPTTTGTTRREELAILRKNLAKTIEDAAFRRTYTLEPTVGDGTYVYLDGKGVPQGMSIYAFFIDLDNPKLKCYSCSYEVIQEWDLEGALDHQRFQHHKHKIN